MNKRFTVEESNLISIFMEKGIDYEQFKERIEEDLHQALADH